MRNIFYKKQSSDWFFYYIVLCIYGFLINFASPIVISLNTDISVDGVYSIYYYWTIFLGIVAFIFVPSQIRRKHIGNDPFYKSSTFVTTIGWLLVTILFVTNIWSTAVLFLIS